MMQLAGLLPEDPVAFVKAAERMTNQGDVEATMAIYAPDATLESITDGAHERHVGTGAIRRAWQVYMGALTSRRFIITKTLRVAADGVIVNEWEGTIAGRTKTRGIERWTFDAEGRVSEHAMYTFLAVRPSSSLLQRLRMLSAYPRTAAAFARSQAKVG
jgi:ketosteroid isomerase-like protein